MSDLAREYARLEKKYSALKRQGVLFTDELREIIEGMPVTASAPYKSAKRTPTKRFVNIMLSDLHFGADLDPSESPMPYGTTEERRSMAAVASEVLDYKTHYRDHTDLVVHLAGDIIDGKLHDPVASAPMAQQHTRALYLISSFLTLAAENYRKVNVYCTPGNHGRIKDRHQQRAVNQKFDSFENIIYESLRVMFRNVPSVEFTIPNTPFYEYSLFGRRGFVTHGDTVLNPGYPGKAINVARLESQILQLIAARGRYDLVAVGHVHVPSVIRLPSTTLLTNGCLIPPDPYAVSIGIHSNTRAQQLWESVPDYLFGDHRMIDIGPHTDNDKSLDKVIPPDDRR